MTEEKQALDPSSKKAKTTIWGTVDFALVGEKSWLKSSWTGLRGEGSSWD